MIHPPVFVLIESILGYHLVYSWLQFDDHTANISFWLGFGVGYLSYDVTHYVLHNMRFSKGSYFHKLQQYHNNHHFSG